MKAKENKFTGIPIHEKFINRNITTKDNKFGGISIAHDFISRILTAEDNKCERIPNACVFLNINVTTKTYFDKFQLLVMFYARPDEWLSKKKRIYYATKQLSTIRTV